MAIVRAHVETVEVIGLDEAYLELTGLPAPHAAMRRVAAEIERRTGLGCSIGIGPNKLVAKVASDAEKPRGFVVLTREQACARFAGAPCGLIPGIGPKTAERLRGLRDRHARQARRGAGRRRWRERFGAAARRPSCSAGPGSRTTAPVTQERKVISESRETTFDRDIARSERARADARSSSSERLCAALDAQDRRGRTIGIKVRLDDFSTHTRARTLPEPVAPPSAWAGGARSAAPLRAAAAGAAARRAGGRPGADGRRGRAQLTLAV